MVNPASYLITTDISSRVKCPVCNNGHLHPFSAKTVNVGNYISASLPQPIVFMAWYLIRHRDKFYLSHNTEVHASVYMVLLQQLLILNKFGVSVLY
jgi:hypothetical protein